MHGNMDFNGYQDDRAYQTIGSCKRVPIKCYKCSYEHVLLSDAFAECVICCQCGSHLLVTAAEEDDTQ